MNQEEEKLTNDNVDGVDKNIKSDDEDNEVPHYGCDHYKRKSKFVVSYIVH